MKYLIWLVLAFSIPFCNEQKEIEDKVIAQVGSHELKLSEIRNMIKPGMNPKDSLNIIKGYRDKWIVKQLLLQRAELNLTSEQKDVSRQLEDYKASLLIYIYEQKLINEKLDTNVTQSEIQEYYNKNTSSFVLSHDIVKALYLKIPNMAPDFEKIHSLYRSEKEEDFKLIDNYCFQNQAEYNYFNEDWVNFEEILSKLPVRVEDKSLFLKTNQVIETGDSLYRYLVNIREYKVRGEQAPLYMIDNNVKNIILNKRKMDFLNDLEENMYKEALQNNKFNVY